MTFSSPAGGGEAVDLDAEYSYVSAKVGFYEVSYDNEGKVVLLEDIANGIRTGKFMGKDLRALTAEARRLASDDALEGQYRLLKKRRLPGITASGIFEPTRKAENLKVHSGLVVLDFDHLADAEAAREMAAQSPHVAAAYISPSGAGVKVLVAVSPIPATRADQREAWQAAGEHLRQIGPVDLSGKDMPRLTFMAYDPDGHFPLKARPLPWQKEKTDVPAKSKQQPNSSPAGGPSAPARDVHAPNLRSVLDHLATQQVGQDDNHLLTVMFGLKGMGHQFDEFDAWAARAGCTCSDRQSRWDSAHPDDLNYAPLFALARKTGWKPPDKKGAKTSKSGGKKDQAPRGSKGDEDAVEQYIAKTVSSGDTLHWLGEWHARRATWAVQDGTALEREILEVLAKSRGVSNPVVHTAALSSYMKSLAVAVAPPCVDTGLLAMEDRLLSFHLDTGEVIAGTIFDNVSVEVKEDGEILTHHVDPRWLPATRRPYSYPLQDPGDPTAFDKWIEQRFRDEPTRNAFYVVLGATILQQLGHNQRFVALLGRRGSTGKGTIFSTLEILLGPGQVTSVTSPGRLAGTFAMGSMRQKSLLAIPDMPEMPRHEGHSKDAYVAGMAVIKNVTGGDPVAVERKFRDPITARLNLGVWMASNFNLTSSFSGTDDDSWHRRMIPFPMEETLPRDLQIPNFCLRFVPERGQIAWKAIQQYSDSKRDGSGFVRTENMSTLARTMLQDSASVIDAYVESLQMGTELWVSRDSLEDGLRATGRRLSVTVGLSEIKNLFRQLRHTIGVSERKKGQDRGFAGVGDPARPT